MVPHLLNLHIDVNQCTKTEEHYNCDEGGNGKIATFLRRVLNPVHHERHDQEWEEAKSYEWHEVVEDKEAVRGIPQVVGEDDDSLGVKKLQASRVLRHYSKHSAAFF